jgi:hypothetical protein
VLCRCYWQGVTFAGVIKDTDDILNTFLVSCPSWRAGELRAAVRTAPRSGGRLCADRRPSPLLFRLPLAVLQYNSNINNLQALANLYDGAGISAYIKGATTKMLLLQQQVLLGSIGASATLKQFARQVARDLQVHRWRRLSGGLTVVLVCRQLWRVQARMVIRGPRLVVSPTKHVQPGCPLFAHLQDKLDYNLNATRISGTLAAATVQNIGYPPKVHVPALAVGLLLRNRSAGGIGHEPAAPAPPPPHTHARSPTHPPLPHSTPPSPPPPAVIFCLWTEGLHLPRRKGQRCLLRESMGLQVRLHSGHPHLCHCPAKLQLNDHSHHFFHLHHGFGVRPAMLLRWCPEQECEYWQCLERWAGKCCTCAPMMRQVLPWCVRMTLVHPPLTAGLPRECRSGLGLGKVLLGHSWMVRGVCSTALHCSAHRPSSPQPAAFRLHVAFSRCW